MTKLEQAKKFEIRAKELRKEARREEKQVKLKLQSEFGKIISEVIGRELSENDIENFRKYATGIGSTYIRKALPENSAK
jgi:predicted RecB family nuclease